MRNLSLFLLVLLFAGATVFAAAKDIRRRLAPSTPEERAALHEMLRDMRGIYVDPTGKTGGDKTAMPTRSNFGYVAKRDIERLKKFLGNLLHLSNDTSSTEESDNGNRNEVKR